MRRNQVALLAGGGGDDSDDAAVVLFGAALLAVTQCDDTRSEAEDAYLRRVLNDENLLAESAALLDELGTEQLAARLADGLAEDQKECLLANLLAVAMVDGELAVEEQELIEQLRSAAGIAEATQARFFEVLLTKNNLAVLG